MIYWFKNLPPKPLSDNTWKPVIPYKWLREKFMAVVYILQFALFVIFMTYIRTYTPTDDIDTQSLFYKILNYMSNNRSIIYILLLAIFIIHEMLHIVIIFNKGDFSITFNYLFLWINTNEEQSKLQRFIFNSLPFLILSVVPFIISFFVSNNFAYIIRIISLFNLMVSSADIINMVIILSKPKKAIFCGGMYRIL